MQNRAHVLVASVGLLASLHWAPPASAQDEVVTTTSPPQTAVVQAVPNVLGGKVLDSEILGRYRGGREVLNDADLNGVVSHNEAIAVRTGNNIISEGSFANASGMPMVVQNTGNNVLIQNSTIVNLQVK